MADIFSDFERYERGHFHTRSCAEYLKMLRSCDVDKSIGLAEEVCQ